ncbi:YesL family protein [Bifidobacterium tsurumiense]|uniref:YesL family protein n=1 Tax=Bifidobacterium tsurumiense TaxID=356829 RepID=UPI0018A6C805|nr:YesL family protein [Bifidobacterium tsurumiense]
MNMFQQDSRFTTAMSTVGDLALLNIAWILCCIPIVTIGASTSALFGTIRNIQEDDDARVLHQFFSLFTRHFSTSLALTLMSLAFYALASFDLWYLGHGAGGTDMAALGYGVCIALTFVVTLATAFVFPNASRSNASAWNQVRNSALQALRRPIPALCITVINALPVVIAVIFPWGLGFVVFFWSLLFTDISAWFIQRIANPTSKTEE